MKANLIAAAVALMLCGGGPVAADLATKEHRLTLGLQPYKFMMRKDWHMFTERSGPLTAQIELQFVSPTKDANIVFYYHIGGGDALHELLHKLKKPSTAESVTPAQIKEVSGAMGPIVANNQYFATKDYLQFKITSCKVVPLNRKVSGLAVEGIGVSKESMHLLESIILLDPNDNGSVVTEIEFSAKTKTAYEKYKPAFDQLLKTLVPLNQDLFGRPPATSRRS
jgi:hypothetical protein